MILEGLVTTANPDGTVNVAPMGPRVEPAMQQLLLRPYPGSRTAANLARTGQGVFHVTDDVELLARAAIDRLDTLPPLLPAATLAAGVEGWIIEDACRWYAFRVTHCDQSCEPWRLEATVVGRGRLRDFFGLNRAKHAVVEAAVLATRTALLSAEQVLSEIERLRAPVEKTGGPAEQRAWLLLWQHVQAAYGVEPSDAVD